jgi:hypothetical protein
VFRPEDIKKRLKEQPFRPFRIIADEGLRYDIRQPDLVVVGQRDLIIGYPSLEDPTIYDGLERVALVRVVKLEDIPSPWSSDWSGPDVGTADSVA